MALPEWKIYFISEELQLIKAHQAHFIWNCEIGGTLNYFMVILLRAPSFKTLNGLNGCVFKAKSIVRLPWQGLQHSRGNYRLEDHRL